MSDSGTRRLAPARRFERPAAEHEYHIRSPTVATQDRDYVLGTSDVEVERLGLQHRVWRADALAAWRRAGFTLAHTLLDVGCGPGYATIDLAGIVGPNGRVVAMDQSRRFLDVLDAQLRHHGVNHVTVAELDLATADLPDVAADGAWCRWVLGFLSHPRSLVTRVAHCLRPGGAFVIHEYFDYRTWRLGPRVPELEEFVSEIIAAWRDTGGEPDIGLVLPSWLEEDGFRIESLTPIVHVVPPSSFVWQWPAAFVDSGLDRLVALGRIDPDRRVHIATAFERATREPGTRMVTPAVLEIIARKL